MVAFEPQPELAAHLQDLARTFGLTGLEVVPRALSSGSGPATLWRRRVGAGDARLGAGRPGDECLRVERTTLDRWLGPGRPRVALIKCDVEGHELEVFRGAEELLAREGPALAFECHDELARGGELFAHLAARGYRGLFFHRGRPRPWQQWPRYPGRGRRRLRNYVFERAARR